MVAPGTVLRATCPTCGVEVERRFIEHSIYVTGDPEVRWHLEHEVDGQRHRWDVGVRVLVKLEAVEGCTVEVVP